LAESILPHEATAVLEIFYPFRQTQLFEMATWPVQNA